MKNKQLQVLLCVVSLALIVALMPFAGACAKPAPTPTPQKVTWKMPFWTKSVDAYPCTVAVVEMAERIKERTGGNFVIEIYPAGQLAVKTPEYLSACATGAIESYLSTSGWMSGDVPVFDIPFLPYFGTTTQDKKAIDDVLKPIYTEDLTRHNLVPILSSSWGFVHPLMTKPLPSILDWSGVKVRTTGPVIIRMCENMGGEGTPIPHADLYTALQRGAVDGEISSVPTAVTRPDPELYKHIYIINIGMGLWLVNVNKDVLAALPDEYRKVLMEEAARVEKEGWGRLIPKDVMEEEAIKIMEEQHGSKIHYATEEQLKQLKEKNERIWYEWAEDKGMQDILKMVRDATGI